MQAQVAAGMPPREVAEHVFSAIREDRFYILPHPDWLPRVRQRMEAILEGRAPRVPAPP
jgi:hypothetical protein